jgi:hypothetical protein
MTECPFLSDLADVKEQLVRGKSTPVRMRPGEVVIWRCKADGCCYTITQRITERMTVDLSKDLPDDLLQHSVFNKHSHMTAVVPA